MFVLTQDRKKLLQLTNATVYRGIGNKFHISIDTNVAGTYPNEKLAVYELEKIAEALKNREEVYTMEPESKDK